MEAKKLLLKILCLSGLLALVSAWLVIFFSIQVNPWFDLFEYAYSDLGSARATMPLIYNLGLMSVGLLIILYYFGILWTSKNRLEAFAASQVFTAGIFLDLIGLFPSGTMPHVFVSSWFFIQFDVAILFLGASYILNNRKEGLALILTAITAPIVFFLVEEYVG